MELFIKGIAKIINLFHDLMIEVLNSLGFNLSDKDLHFWFIGVLGLFSFLIVQVTFRRLAKWSITAISLIYTLTVLIVVVFAIEIQQGITGRGNMEFADAVVGLYGFFAFFFAYVLFRLAVFGVKRLFEKYRKPKPTKYGGV